MEIAQKGDVFLYATRSCLPVNSAGAKHMRDLAGRGLVILTQPRSTLDPMAGAARKSGSALQTIAVQLPDITQGLLTGQKPFQVFIQQGFQIVQVAQMGQGGLRGFGKEVAGLALRFAPLLAGLAIVTAGFALFTRWVNDGVKTDTLTRDLGKITGGANATKAELYKLKEETVTWADTSKALFSVVGKDISDYFVGDMKGMSKGVKGVLDDLTSYARQSLAGIYAGVAGTKAYLGEIEKGDRRVGCRPRPCAGDVEGNAGSDGQWLGWCGRCQVYRATGHDCRCRREQQAGAGRVQCLVDGNGRPVRHDRPERAARSAGHG